MTKLKRQPTHEPAPHGSDGVALDVAATVRNFDEAAYLSGNPDVAGAVSAGSLPSGYDHFLKYGLREGRKLRLSAPLANMRARKMKRIQSCLRDDIAFERRGAKYDYLTDAIRAETRVAETDAVSAHPYDADVEALIGEFPDGIVVDCGAGRRPVYYPNVINLEIVDYDTTDIVSAAEILPFLTGSIDAIISIAVLAHLRDPFRCAAEIARVLKPGGKLLCVAPFLQPEHAYPHHYYNMAPQGLRALFEDRLTIDDHKVAPSTLPVWTLTWLLRSWAEGLTGTTRDAFLDLSIRDLAGADPGSLLDQPWVKELPTKKNFELASATMLLAHKT